MKETLITFETAKLAKEKGFDIPCLQAYSVWREDIRKSDKNPLQDIGVEYDPYMGGVSTSVAYYYQSKEHTLAPTQALLQKWLREEHMIKVIANHADSNGTYNFTLWVWNHDNDIGKWKRLPYLGTYVTYEEALEEGLLIACATIT